MPNDMALDYFNWTIIQYIYIISTKFETIMNILDDNYE